MGRLSLAKQIPLALSNALGVFSNIFSSALTKVFASDGNNKLVDEANSQLKILTMFPKGLDTFLGERGTGLSEGQMQRIAIARAIYANRPILVLDESTSALDEEMEKKVLSNLREMTEKTVLIVTHRKAALKICDMELRFSEGRIREISLKLL